MKTNEIKTCNACGKDKLIDCFYKRHAVCKDCYNEKRRAFLATPEGKEWQRRHTERYNHSPKGLAKRQEYARTRGVAATARWTKAHPDKVKAYQQSDEGKATRDRVNHKKRCLPGAACDLTAAQWLQIKDDYCNACAYCGRQDKPLTIDHVLPLRQGGGHTASNVVPACGPCNIRKGTRTPEEWGVPIRPKGTPPQPFTATPITYAQVVDTAIGYAVTIKGEIVWDEEALTQLWEDAHDRCLRLAELLNKAYTTWPVRRRINGVRVACTVMAAKL